MTTSTSLYAAGISSRNASVSRNSIPAMASRSWSCVKVFRAAVREYARPAPWGELCSDSGSPLPDTT